MTRKMRSDVKGLILSLFGKPLPLTPAQKEPVAYLYNGVRLPKLPEWDREKYPYAVIWEQPSNNYVARYYGFAACKTPIEYYYFSALGVNEYLQCSDGTIGYVKCILNRNDNTWDEEWQTLTENTTQVFSGSGDAIEIWANHDIVRTDNSEVYLAASDPIPVYE